MSAVTESQQLVTEATFQLLELDFTTIGGSAHVYLSTEHSEAIAYRQYDDPTITWTDGPHTFKRIDFQMSGISSDLTGAVAEPTLNIAAADLWLIPAWQTGTTKADGTKFNLMDYRGLRVRRQRMFFGTTTLITPQVFYVKSVDQLSATTITFTLTPSLGSERLDRPSARKLEI